MSHSAEDLKLTAFSSLTSPSSIPLFSFPIRAGFPSPAEDYIEKKLDLNELLIKRPAATFFVRVEGNSMRDAHILEGDILIVDRSITPTDGKIVIAIVNGEFTVKRLKKKGNSISLEAANPEFSPLVLASGTEFEVWGVVTYIIHKAS